MNTVDKNNKPVADKRKGINWLLVLCAFGYPIGPAFIFFFIFTILYLGTESPIFLIFAILTVLVYLGIAIFLLVHFSKKDVTSYPTDAPVKDSDLTSDEADAFSAGLLGGALLGRILWKHHCTIR